jgi:hypothetical protein
MHGYHSVAQMKHFGYRSASDTSGHRPCSTAGSSHLAPFVKHKKQKKTSLATRLYPFDLELMFYSLSSAFFLSIDSTIALAESVILSLLRR